jgi:hypothetical protein
VGISAALWLWSKLPSNRATVGAPSRAPRELPHTAQNARLDASDDLNVLGAPPGPVQVTRSRGNSTQVAVKAPLWRWHILQEQW